jgi:Tim17/Tim22/Tim23/Pmp24 family
MYGAGAGFIVGAMQEAWYPDPYEVDSRGRWREVKLGLGHLIRSSRKPFILGTIICSTYSGVECLLEQLRDPHKESTYVNAGIAGAVSGVMMGSLTKRFDIMACSALGGAIVMGVSEFNAHYNALVARGESPVEKVPVSKTSEKSLKELYPEYKNL